MGVKLNMVAGAIANFETIFASVSAVSVVAACILFVMDVSVMEFKPACWICVSEQKPEIQVCSWSLLAVLTPVSLKICADLSNVINGKTTTIFSSMDLRNLQTFYAVQTMLFLITGLLLSDYIPMYVSAFFGAYRFIIALPFTTYYLRQRMAGTGDNGYLQKIQSPTLLMTTFSNLLRNETPPPAYETLEMSV